MAAKTRANEASVVYTSKKKAGKARAVAGSAPESSPSVAAPSSDPSVMRSKKKQSKRAVSEPAAAVVQTSKKGAKRASLAEMFEAALVAKTSTNETQSSKKQSRKPAPAEPEPVVHTSKKKAAKRSAAAASEPVAHTSKKTGKKAAAAEPIAAGTKKAAKQAGTKKAAAEPATVGKKKAAKQAAAEPESVDEPKLSKAAERAEARRLKVLEKAEERRRKAQERAEARQQAKAEREAAAALAQAAEAEAEDEASAFAELTEAELEASERLEQAAEAIAAELDAIEALEAQASKAGADESPFADELELDAEEDDDEAEDEDEDEDEDEAEPDIDLDDEPEVEAEPEPEQPVVEAKPQAAPESPQRELLNQVAQLIRADEIARARARELRRMLRRLDDPSAAPTVMALFDRDGDPFQLRTHLMLALERMPESAYFHALLDALPRLYEDAPEWAFSMIMRLLNTRGTEDDAATRFEAALHASSEELRDIVLDLLDEMKAELPADQLALIDELIDNLGG